MAIDRQQQVQQQQQMVASLRKQYRALPRMTMRRFKASFPAKKPAKGQVWIAHTRFEAPAELDVRNALYAGIHAFAKPEHKFPPEHRISIEPVSVEWLGQRPDVGPDAHEPDLSEPEKYRLLQEDVEHPLVILYAHGGAFYAGNPVFVRPATVKLAKLTKGRVASVAYRQAPQHEFPDPLLDLFVAYLSLISPGANDLHKPVPPKCIVFAGESAGGNLAMALLQLLLELGRQGRKNISFHGRSVPLALPGGIACLSPFVDYALSLPSWLGNDRIDFLSAIQSCQARENWDVDDTWPTNPPRSDIYCDASLFTHPLVNPAVTPSWEGSPPLWLATGEERLTDGIRLVASRAASQGVSVIFSQYEGLPHEFAIMLGKLPQSIACYNEWAGAAVQFAGGGLVETKGKVVPMPGDGHKPIDVFSLSPFTLEEAEEMALNAARQRDPWRGPGTVKSSL